MVEGDILPQICELTERRSICNTCERPTKVCFCEFIPNNKLGHSTAIYILQHPAEASAPFRTTPILERCLQYVQVVKSSKMPPEWNELQQQDLVLFPTENAVPVQNIARGQYRLFIIDGTWSSARSMYKRNRNLQVRRNVTLSDQSLMGGIPLFLLRKPPSDIVQPYCTAEAVATALYWLEQDEANAVQIYHTIRECIRQVCEKQMQYISKDSLRHRRQRQGYIEGLYEQWQTKYTQE